MVDLSDYKSIEALDSLRKSLGLMDVDLHDPRAVEAWSEERCEGARQKEREFFGFANAADAERAVFDTAVYGRAVRLRRSDLGIDKAELLSEIVFHRTFLYISVQSIYRIESGRTTPTPQQMFALNLTLWGELMPSAVTSLCLGETSLRLVVGHDDYTNRLKHTAIDLVGVRYANSTPREAWDFYDEPEAYAEYYYQQNREYRKDLLTPDELKRYFQGNED